MSECRNSEFESVNFGICIKNPKESIQNLYFLPIDESLKLALIDMLETTESHLRIDRAEHEVWEPSQVYGNAENQDEDGAICLIMPLSDPVVEPLRNIYEAQNIEFNANAVKRIQNMKYYFAVFSLNNSRIIGVRRARQFKGIVKAQNRLFWFSEIDDTLKIVESSIFKLDYDFDFIITHDKVLISRPAGFEEVAGTKQHIIESARATIQQLTYNSPCVDLRGIEKIFSKGGNIRIAKILASILQRGDLHLISKDLLLKDCEAVGVQIREIDGKLSPVEGHEISFVQILDRRLYAKALIEGEIESYEASNRRRRN